MQFEVSSLYRHHSLPACFCPEKSQRAEFLGQQFSHKSSSIHKKVVQWCLKFLRKDQWETSARLQTHSSALFSIHGNSLLFSQVALNETGKCSGPFVTALGAIFIPVGTCSLQSPLLPMSGSRPLGFLWTEIGETVLPPLCSSTWVDRFTLLVFWGWNQLSPSHHDQRCPCSVWFLPLHLQLKTWIFRSMRTHYASLSIPRSFSCVVINGYAGVFSSECWTRVSFQSGPKLGSGFCRDAQGKEAGLDCRTGQSRGALCSFMPNSVPGTCCEWNRLIRWLITFPLTLRRDVNWNVSPRSEITDIK